MLGCLTRLDDEVRLREAQFVAGRTDVSRGLARTGDAAMRRLAQPDLLIGAAGAGALYGLWVTRSCRACNEKDGNNGKDGNHASTSLLPSWLVRLAVSSAVSWWLSTNTGADTGADVGAS